MVHHKLSLFAPGAIALALIVSGCSPTSSDDVTGEVDDGAPDWAQVEVETLPTDDIDEHIEEMPDGVHLRPGVDIFRIVEPGLSYVHFEDETTTVYVGAPAVDAFDGIGAEDIVFAGDKGFIVDARRMDGDVLVIDASPIDLSRVLWGNWKIPFNLDLTEVARQHDHIEMVEEVPDAVDDDGLTTHQQPLRLLNVSIPETTFRYSAGELVIKPSHLRIDADMDGAFEGRIGRFKRSYRCADGGNFCVDRLAVWADSTIDGHLKGKATLNAAVTGTHVETWAGPTTIGRPIPIGTTGLAVNIEYVLRSKFELQASANGEMKEAQYTINKSAPIGFEYRNNSGMSLLPKDGQTSGSADGAVDFALTGTVTYTTNLQAGLIFGLSDSFGIATLRGSEIKAVINKKITWRPLQVDDDPQPCLQLDVALQGVATAYLEFEVDAWIWKWKEALLCESKDCAEISTNPIMLVEEKSDAGCIDLYFDKLVVDVARTDEPLGLDGIDGMFEIDAICKERVLPRNPRAGRMTAETRVKCVDTPQLREVSNECPIDTSGWVALPTGEREFSFGESILPGDTIMVSRGNAQTCNGSGAARYSLKRGSQTRPLGNGELIEGSIELVFE